MPKQSTTQQHHHQQQHPSVAVPAVSSLLPVPAAAPALPFLVPMQAAALPPIAPLQPQPSSSYPELMPSPHPAAPSFNPLTSSSMYTYGDDFNAASYGGGGGTKVLGASRPWQVTSGSNAGGGSDISSGRAQQRLVGMAVDPRTGQLLAPVYAGPAAGDEAAQQQQQQQEAIQAPAPLRSIVGGSGMSSFVNAVPWSNPYSPCLDLPEVVPVVPANPDQKVRPIATSYGSLELSDPLELVQPSTPEPILPGGGSSSGRRGITNRVLSQSSSSEPDGAGFNGSSSVGPAATLGGSNSGYWHMW